MTPTAASTEGELDLELPDLDLPELGDEADEATGLDGDGPEDSGADEMDGEELPRDDDPFDDKLADDVPLDVEIHTEATEPTVVGDDAVGLDDGPGEEEVSIHEDGASSLIDDGRGHAEEGIDFVGDDELGIDPIPTEVDDGGHDGLDDPAGERVEEQEFPPLDGAEDDDDAEELDVGLDIEGD